MARGRPIARAPWRLTISCKSLTGIPLQVPASQHERGDETWYPQLTQGRVSGSTCEQPGGHAA